MLSKRSQRFMYDEQEVMKYSAYKALWVDPYDPIKNPNGTINLGTAVNGLMDDVLLERFKEKNNFFELSPLHFRYYQFSGSDEFRRKLSQFMTKFFRITEPLCYENILVLNGALLSLDIIISLIADEEDVILFPTPCYPSYFQAGYQRWNVEMCPIPMSHNRETGEFFELTISIIEKKFLEQILQGKKVKAFLLNNPHNPLGKVFSKELILDIMNFCQRNNLHLIADEVYCMSVFDKNTTYHSVLELKNHKSNILDLERIHVYWGFSKDLCLTSFRAGVIHTQNKKLKMAILSSSQFQAVPLPVLNLLENFISDLVWFEEIFLPKNHERLTKAYRKVKATFYKMGITTTTTSAGFFLLADFRSYLKPVDQESIKEYFYRYKIFVTPSWQMKSPEPGWFRVVFSFPDEILEEGLSRIQNALEDLEKSRTFKLS